VHELPARALEVMAPGTGHEVAAFVHGCQCEDGGFRGRSTSSDLYATSFALACLAALGEIPDQAVVGYLRSFGDGEELDLVHLCCLLRSWGRLNAMGGDGADVAPLLGGLERFRRPGQGYRLTRDDTADSVYASFLALLASSELAGAPRELESLGASVAAHRSRDGAFAEGGDAVTGTTTVSAAAVVLLDAVGAPVPPEVLAWLAQRQDPAGGVYAVPGAPTPDLLSTATALYALWRSGWPLAPTAAAHLDFVEQLWRDDGGFAAHRGDPMSDCEYTYYALLSLGVLADEVC